jgi:hypothetical protein
MKIGYAIVIFILLSSMSYAQYGIGTTEPKTTLDVQGEPTNTALADGVKLPSMSLAELEAKITATTSAYNADHDGVMVFINDVTGGSTIAQTAGITSKGIYFFSHDGTTGRWYAVGENKLWSTSGNAGTDETTDFIGTTDNVALNFRVNDTKAGRIGLFGDRSVFLGFEAGLSDGLSETWNTFIGYQAGRANTAGLDNTAIGHRALFSNTTGRNNTATGTNALFSNTIGRFNTANGSSSLFNNTTGASNTAVGYQALRSNTIGNNNTANGHQALYSNTANSRSTAVGYQAMEFADDRTSGRETYNTALGYQALRGSTTAANNTGRYNTAIGDEALYSNTSGDNNTSIGRTALFANTTGSNNTALGVSANSVGNYTNSTALGFNAEPFADNTIRLGNSSVSTIGGYANWTNVSDGRFKQNVKENVVGLEFIKKLRPVTYNLDMDALARFNKTPDSLRLRDAEQLKAAELQTGFIAQEVEQAAKEVGFDFHGVDKPKNAQSHYGLRYAEFVVPLVKAVQEQQEFIEQQNEKIEFQDKKTEQLGAKLEEQSLEINRLKALIETQQNQIKALMDRFAEE